MIMEGGTNEVSALKLRALATWKKLRRVVACVAGGGLFMSCRNCVVSGSEIPLGDRAFRLNDVKIDLLIQNGIFPKSRKETMKKESYICAQHFEFPSECKG